MVSTNEEACMELVFDRENSANRQEKVKAFWKFLDAQDNLQPYKGIPEEKPVETKSSSAEETLDERDVWRRGLEVFRRLGLDRTALAADNRCELCLVDRTIRCEDLADTVAQPYEELNADMTAFERRRESNSDQIDEKMPRTDSARCDPSDRVKKEIN